MGQVGTDWGMSELLVQVGMKLSISERGGASRTLLDKAERGQRCRGGGSWNMVG